MKIIISYIIGLILLLQMTTQSLFAQHNIVMEEVNVITEQFEQREGTLYIKFYLDMNNVKIKSRQTLSYTPIISTFTKSINLPKISLRGRNSYKEYLRKIALMTKKERADYESQLHATIKAFGSNKKYIDYEYVTTYEDWMSDSKLLLDSDISSCTNRESLKSEVLANITLEALPIAPTTLTTPIAPIAPIVSSIERVLIDQQFTDHISQHEKNVETIEMQEDQGILKIYFPVGVTTVDENYMGNADELRDLKSVINDIKRSKNLNIAKVFIAGFASIEGTIKINERFSLRRTNSIHDYILKNTNVADSLIEVYNGTENWNGLRQMIVESDIIDKKAILNIIDNVPIYQGRERELMILNGGEPYRYMMRYFFPKLRYVYIKVYFDNEGSNN